MGVRGSDSRGHTRRSVAVGGLWLLTLVIAVGATWWAFGSTVARPQIEGEESGVETIAVIDGSLGRSYSVPVVASWGLEPLADALESGAITSVVVTSGAQVEANEVLFTVDLRPTVIGVGAVPSFRDLSEGMKGADVKQLQQLLIESGYLRAGRADGTFGPVTTTAVKAWQKALGVEQTGAVLSTDVVYAPTLPARVTLADSTRVGALVSPGEPIVYLVSHAPTFEAILEPEQASVIHTDEELTIQTSDGTWAARIADIRIDPETQRTMAVLEGPDGGAVCGQDCVAAVPATAEGNAFFEGQVVVIPRTNGPQVPASAVLSDPDGTTYVVDPDGTRLPVTVVVAADGQMILDGIAVGQQVLVAPANG